MTRHNELGDDVTCRALRCSCSCSTRPSRLPTSGQSSPSTCS